MSAINGKRKDAIISMKYGIRLALDMGLTFVYLIVFYFVAYGLMLIDVIDDGVFAINKVFIGFYHWIYLIPLIIYLKKKMKPFRGYLVGGY